MVLREEGVVRIYDIFFDYDVLLSTDLFPRSSPARNSSERCRRRGISQPLRQVRSASGRKRSASDRSRCSRRRTRRAFHLYVVTGRQLDRMNIAPSRSTGTASARSESGATRRIDSSRCQAWRGKSGVMILAAEARRTSCSDGAADPGSAGIDERVTTISFRSRRAPGYRGLSGATGRGG